MLPPISSAVLPAEVRNGTAQDKKDYQSAVSFEQMLVGQLVKSMAGSAGGGDSDPDADGTTNALADGPYASQMQDALTAALTSGSGLGLASQIYKEMQK